MFIGDKECGYTVVIVVVSEQLQKHECIVSLFNGSLTKHYLEQLLIRGAMFLY